MTTHRPDRSVSRRAALAGLGVGGLGLTFQGPALGVWEATEDRSGHFTVIQALSDADGAYVGTF